MYSEEVTIPVTMRFEGLGENFQPLAIYRIKEYYQFSLSNG